ncbi:MAG: DUF1540 domain-containing protein [Clostridia bacterium]|nr:DUF1540 domain-containing protein [Clostridia bacterium]
MAHPVTVMCTVSSCDFWGQGNVCDAREILITADSFAAAQPDNIDALQAGALPQTAVQRCEETSCKTFRPKGSKAGPNLHR